MIIVLKGSASSGWFAPPRGTHSGEQHRKVGSGKAGGESVTFYHGSSAKIVDSVLSDGLRVGRSWHYRPPSVYVADDAGLALGYAIDRARNVAPLPKNIGGVVFEIKVPSGSIADFIPDTKLPGLTISAGQSSNISWRVPNDIPKEWIVGYKVYSVDTTTRAWWTTPADDLYTLFEEVVQTKSVPVIKKRMFVVIILDVGED